jgi:N utilization substance protein B
VTPIVDYHRVRRLALQGLCALDVQGEKAVELILQFIEESRESEETLKQARHTMLCAFAELKEADALLVHQAQHWNVARMALVDRNILRLTIWELRTQSTPKKVVINEAIQLAKEFASAESPRFVNGVLDAVAKRLRGDAGEE